MTRTARSWIPGAAAAAALLAIHGCAAAGKAGGTRGEAAQALPAPLRDLWERHGGADAWRRHAAVRFSYRASSPRWGGDIEIPEVAFRLRDARRLWVRLSPGAEPIPLDSGGAGDGWQAVQDAARSRGADPAELAFGLRLLPYFLGLPLSATLGPWEFRVVLGPGGAAVPGWLEAAPGGHGPPVGSTFLSADGRTGLLAEALYAVLLPEPDPVPRRVTFEDYGEAGGVRLALRRIHREARRPGPAVGEPWAPYAPSPDGDERGEEWSLREEIRDVVFLDEEEADMACPLAPPSESQRP